MKDRRRDLNKGLDDHRLSLRSLPSRSFWPLVGPLFHCTLLSSLLAEAVTMQFYTFIALLAVFASRVLALNITLPTLGAISASEFLDVQDADIKTNCQDVCTPATNAISACSDNDSCLCNTATVTAITACQQCMFTDLIHRFTTASDPRIGSAPALTAYVTACNASGIVVPATEVALTVPSDWNGPFGQGLNIAGTVITVGAALFLGLGCIGVVNSM